MKICIIIIGAIRLDSFTLVENIKQMIENFQTYEITLIFVTWEPIEKTYIVHNINYYYEYDKINVTENITSCVDAILFMNNLEIENVVKLKNGMAPLFMYQLSCAKDFILANELNFDYIVKTRNDIQIKINDIHELLNDKVYIPPAYWLYEYNSDYNIPLNDHFFIMPFTLFKSIDISVTNIINMTPHCMDCEELNYRLIKPDVIISSNHIKLYKTMGTAKVLIEN